MVEINKCNCVRILALELAWGYPVEESPANVICANFQHLKTANLNTRMKVLEENPTSVTSASLQPLKQPSWEFIREHSGENSTNVTDVIICKSNRQMKFAYWVNRSWIQNLYCWDRTVLKIDDCWFWIWDYIACQYWNWINTGTNDMTRYAQTGHCLYRTVWQWRKKRLDWNLALVSWCTPIMSWKLFAKPGLARLILWENTTMSAVWSMS